MAVTSYKFPGMAVNSDLGKNDWSNPDYVKADDDNWATCQPAKNDYGDNLICTNFGFTTDDIPDGSSIDGIEIEIMRKASIADRIKDDFLRLIYNSVEQGGNKASATFWPTSEGTATYGGAADNWGASALTDANIRNSSFGMLLRIYCDGVSCLLYTSPSPRDS